MLLIAAVLAAASAHRGTLQIYQDWIVGCDNTRACQATALLPKTNAQDFRILEVSRNADATAAPMIEILDAPHGTCTIALDAARFAVQPDENDEIEVAPADVSAVLSGARTLPYLRLLSSEGAVVGKVSLAGAAAALLAMNEAQLRSGTVTAMIRRGPKAASTVPPSPRLPVVVATARSLTPPARFGAAVARRQLGESAFRVGDDKKDEPPTFQRLDATHTLALQAVTCGDGFNNHLFVASIVVDGHASDPVDAVFETVAGDGLPTVSDYNLEWDPKAGVLHAGFNGDRMGDCGLHRDYVWVGRRFRRVEESQMGECRGAMDPITTWRSVVKR